MIFYFRLIVNKSHGEMKTNNEWILLKVVKSVSGGRQWIIESHSQVVKYWCCGLTAQAVHQPKASLFYNLGIRLDNQLSYKLPF